MTKGFFETASVPALWGAIVPFLVLDFIAIGLRFHVRRRLRQPLLADDWLMIPSLIGVTAIVILYLYALGVKSLGYRWMLIPSAEEGGAQRLLDPDFVPTFAEPENDRIMLTRYTEFSTLVIFAFLNGLIKISVLLFYRRIFVVDHSWRNSRNLFFNVLITLIAVWATTCGFVFLFMCGTSFSTLFNVVPAELAEKCVDTLKVGWQYAVGDFVSDGIIILVPLPFIWSLRLNWNRKLAVTIFLLGILAAGASLTRLAWMKYNNSVGLGPETDEELMITYELFWMNLEITLGLLAANLPALRGLLKSDSRDGSFSKIRSLFSLRSSSNGSFNNSSKGYSRTSSEKSKAITVTVNSDFSRISDSDNRV